MIQKKNVWIDFIWNDSSTHPSHKDFVIFVIHGQEFTGDGPYYSGDYMYNLFHEDENSLAHCKNVRCYMIPDAPKERASI